MSSQVPFVPFWAYTSRLELENKFESLNTMVVEFADANTGDMNKRRKRRIGRNLRIEEETPFSLIYLTNAIGYPQCHDMR
jgi:hypothetical protein